MTRKTYFYCLIILGTLLNILLSLKDVVGVQYWLIISALLIIVAWGCVWMRLFTSNLLRPELSILTVLPTGLYVYFSTFGAPMLMYYTEFFNLIAWAVAALILVVSIKPTIDEKKALGNRDISGSILKILSILYAISSWATTSFSLFLTNQ